MKIAIHEKRFVKSASLVNEGDSYAWKTKTPPDAFVIGDPQNPMSVLPAFELLDKEYPELISEKICKAFKILGIKSLDLPVDMVQSSKQMISSAKNCFLESRMALEEIDSWGYLDTLTRNYKTLRSLQRAAIDFDRLKRAFSSGEIKNKSVLKNFRPGRDGFLDLPVYSLTKTLTGRMTVISGPQILTAPKFIRKYLKSSFKNGNIVQIDFVSLEPRVAIQSQGHVLTDDVYEFIREKVFSNEVNRRTVKKLVLCAIYGASEATIKKDIPKNFSISKCVKETKKILNFDKIVSEQKSSYRKSKKIHNFFGRPINPQDSRDSLLYNNYVQSTSVDVSLAGFGQIIDRLPDGCRPLFFIHDALILDVRKEALEEFKKISSSIHINNMGDFPLDFQILS